MSDVSLERLEKERSAMDACLQEERLHVDREIEKAHKEVSAQVDSTLENARNDVERGVEAQRVRHDQKTSTLGQSSSVQTEMLEKERRKIDESRERERAVTDSMHEKERVQVQRIEKQLFAAEREATDEALSLERRKNDDLLSKVKNLLGRNEVEIQSLEDFLAMVSHDLRNPLNAISIAADEIESELPSDFLKGNVRQFLDVIKRASVHMQRLVEDLLDYQRIETGRLSLDVRTQDLRPTLREVVELAQRGASAKEIDIKLTVPDEPLLCELDPIRISQVVDNLLTNAIRHSPKNETVEIWVQAQEQDFQVTVADRGIGVPKEKIQKIFERFEQVGDRNRQGLGLGLYISKHLIESHHGKIWYEDREGGGSLFHFTLPKT